MSIVTDPAAASGGGPAAHGRLRAWAYLSRVAEAPCAALLAFIERDHGGDPVAAAAAVRSRTALPDAVASATRARYATDVSQRDLTLIGSLGGRLVTRDSDEWPLLRTQQFGLPDVTPDGSPPVALWTVGTLDLARLETRAVAIVGTRAASGYGEHVTAELAGDLAAQEYVVVSGAAYGVDGAAHRAALGVGGKTVAILACGVDRAYPAGHARLLRAIAENGAVLSEYPPGVVPGRHRFLARNRLVAGLSDATVVVEAGRRSGALNTAGWAERMNRYLLAVPGPVTSAASAGCHMLLRQDRANLAVDAEDVMEVAGPFGALGAAPSAGPAPRPTDGLTAVQLAVHDGLPARGARSSADISAEAGVGLDETMAALAVLELGGLAFRSDEGWALARAVGRAPRPG
ncbi:DNA-processing protein DprA [Tomitella fengzijianii]|uniref:DNA-protecting protein DprA n=1 Tax=Tomitella fengzijianii TaxID=2597660 RepID=A0A516X3R7_9ACTN|nr:DNA-processing protein DprA [Tomitella fengzijianii]QDQ97694.1 DNA-protecting protein DprA [Tomitella fengzijianii]